MEGMSKSTATNSSHWSREEDVVFERALATIPEFAPDRWERIALLVPGKTSDEVFQHYLESKLVFVPHDSSPEDLANHTNSSLWSREDEVFFENALAIIPEGTPDRLEKIAALLPWKTVDEVVQRYADLEEHTGKSPEELPNPRNLLWSGKGTDWTKEEHRLFLEGLERYGRGNWAKISEEVVKSRTRAEVQAHANKYFRRVERERRQRRRQSVSGTVMAAATSSFVGLNQEPVIRQDCAGPNIPQNNQAVIGNQNNTLPMMINQDHAETISCQSNIGGSTLQSDLASSMGQGIFETAISSGNAPRPISPNGESMLGLDGAEQNIYQNNLINQTNVEPTVGSSDYNIGPSFNQSNSNFGATMDQGTTEPDSLDDLMSFINQMDVELMIQIADNFRQGFNRSSNDLGANMNQQTMEPDLSVDDFTPFINQTDAEPMNQSSEHNIRRSFDQSENVGPAMDVEPEIGLDDLTLFINQADAEPMMQSSEYNMGPSSNQSENSGPTMNQATTGPDIDLDDLTLFIDQIDVEPMMQSSENNINPSLDQSENSGPTLIQDTTDPENFLDDFMSFIN